MYNQQINVVGIVIYPSTKIRRCYTGNEGAVGFEFLDVNLSDFFGQPSDNNSGRIINEIGINNRVVPINEIFQFEFDRAYVFHAEDLNMDGMQFSDFYNLNLSIDQLKKSDFEYVKRIVFVDKKGTLVYAFDYSSNVLDPKVEGIIIYPTTTIKQCPTDIEGSVGIEFLDVKESDYY